MNIKKTLLLLTLVITTFVLSTGAYADFTASDWAKGELDEAAGMGIIPDSLQNADLTQDITRA
ncbi:MAG: hypothetical protein IJT38_00975 [Clostridia bacterium]|nr:hypothetical protein [Clostridia bacterium]